VIQGVILAAGKGKRLKPVTLKVSKAMSPILDKPIIGHVLECLHLAVGIRDFVVVVSTEDKDICDYLESQWRDRAQFRFAYQDRRMGMADALMHAVPYIDGEEFLLAACDNLHRKEHIAELVHCHREFGNNGTLSLMRVPPEKLSKGGVVEIIDGEISRIVEKPDPEDAPSDMASLPLYVFRREILEYLPHVGLSPRGEYELQDAMQMMINEHGGFRGVITDARFSLTSVQDLLDINAHYLDEHLPPDSATPQAMGKGSVIEPPVFLGHNVVLGDGCRIGPYVVIGNDSCIGDGCDIKHSVVFEGTTLEAGVKVQDWVLFDGIPKADEADNGS